MPGEILSHLQDLHCIQNNHSIRPSRTTFHNGLHLWNNFLCSHNLSLELAAYLFYQSTCHFETFWYYWNSYSKPKWQFSANPSFHCREDRHEISFCSRNSNVQYPWWICQKIDMIMNYYKWILTLCLYHSNFTT